MKSFKTLLCLLLLLSSATTFSQTQGKAKTLFARFPQSILLSENILKETINGKEGNRITIAFTPEFNFEGIIISNKKNYENLRTILIRSERFDNAVFQLTRVENRDKTATYAGRLMQTNAADGYEIKRDSKNNYSFNKVETSRIFEPCTQ